MKTYRLKQLIPAVQYDGMNGPQIVEAFKGCAKMQKGSLLIETGSRFYAYVQQGEYVYYRHGAMQHLREKDFLEMYEEAT